MALVLAMACPAAADTMKCGRFQVTVGDTKATVLRLCGEPAVREVVSGGEGATSVRKEQWIYDRGKGRFQALLTFEGVGLRRIEFLSDQ
ncbi:MAG TPA: DUF2845 domain-containing protein [bacterium]